MERMERRAADNKYLHKDFHGILNLGITYLQQEYGDDAVKEYLQEYTKVFHKPLIDKTKAEGLSAIEDYFKKLFETEEVADDISFKNGEYELVIKIVKCPAVSHMKKTGIKPADLFIETTRVIGQTLADETGFAYELVSYEDETGASVQKFYGKAE